MTQASPSPLADDNGEGAIVDPALQKRVSWFDDVLLLGIMAALAGCGLIYEYLLSNYAGRILGALEAAIYTMIGLMIVSMGIGAFAARKIRCAFTGFATLELAIALCGGLAIIITAAIIGFGHVMPVAIASQLNLPPDQLPDGGVIHTFQVLSHYIPYAWGVLLGLMIGMEIPLIARVRQSLSEAHLLHNAGTIYGADYIGAGVGAAIWVGFMLAIDIQLAAAMTASVNLIAGLAFIWRFWQQIRYVKLLFVGHIIACAILGVLAYKGPQWEQGFNNLLYKDNVVYTESTRFQQLTFTERLRGSGKPPVYNLYINGRLQFSSIDEHIYHDFLVHPTLAASARTDNVLIIGGGDGLGLKQVLKWQPKSVTLMDLDEKLVALFKQPPADMPKRLSRAMLALNDDALNDSRVNLIYDDAFNGVDKLIGDNQKFDAIIIDLPDPSHPDLNKLYSDMFYRKVAELLSADGVVTVQSTSPYHAPEAFMAIGKTLSASGFNVSQYHHNVPSFGEWGWTSGTLKGAPMKSRINKLDALPVEMDWITLGLMQASFEFPLHFYDDLPQIKVNEIGSLQLYRYHQGAWSEQELMNLF
ncbi:polyamine aminopropyltransferase [Shewanella maritima]|uniref:Polyamine aminopropyltransferase n=1 Tax=Shewanella maritima TaxID=2520507 RepID=A0A411PFM7_9GAMM|nr:polyamine aminopropyltransferase [Shewanella maritima]QBF82345.1 polyamine aminopropyltransferase [Shewanella maritima]